jgi:diguanylate cyclase (GGDEF)-like protein
VISGFLQGLASRHDELTGLVSQSYSEERFIQELARLQRHQTPFSMLVLTVENYLDIYESIGHKAGQTALQNFAGTVVKSMRITDICSRTAFNQMTVVLPNTNLDQARGVCAKLSRIISPKDIMDSPHETDICLEVSAGIAEANDKSTLDEVLAVAQSRQSTFYEFRVC